MTYSWSLVGKRKVIPYEGPKRRRVHAIGAYCPGVDFLFQATSAKLDAEVFATFLESLPPAPDGVPTYVVLDNYSVHKAKRIRHRIEALAARGVHLFFLSPYSPELNLIEPCWRAIKHQKMQVRLFKTQEALHEGVEGALTAYRQEITGKPSPLDRAA